MPLLLYLSHAGDPQRFAVGPTLAGLAERAGWEFDCYYAARRLGRHFGGGDPSETTPGRAAGSLVAGGRHADQVLWLAARHELVALGDPLSPLWPALRAAGAEELSASSDPVALYRAAHDRLGQELPSRGVVLDASPQGRHALVVAPYLYPGLLAGLPSLAIVTPTGATPHGLASLGVTDTVVLPAGEKGDTYASLTARLAREHRDWGRGFLLGDPELVAAQLPKARRLRLLPLYGQPQTAVLQAAHELVEGEGPVYGRQYDDHDFFELAELGRSFQLLDPDPPFDSARASAPLAGAVSPAEPSDEQLERWAAEGRVLATMLLWSGMTREVDCLTQLLDVTGSTGLQAGLVATTATAEYGQDVLGPGLAAPSDRGGVGDQLEILLASAGDGVAAEHVLGAERLARRLPAARELVERLLAVRVRGWWPLLDSPLVPVSASPLGLRGRRPVVRFTPRGTAAATPDEGWPRRRDPRALIGAAVRRVHADRWLEARRPFDAARPGRIDQGIAETIRVSGFEYMWTKTDFGEPRIVHRLDDFVALSLTAGRWGGWSPFYALGGVRDAERAEKRLLRGGAPGWLVGTLDSPLWALSGEVYTRGPELLRLAELIAQGGRSCELINVTPNVVARYARIAGPRLTP
jgi:hypothetical protein